MSIVPKQGLGRSGFRLESLVNVVTLLAATLLVASIVDQYTGQQLAKWISKTTSQEKNLKGSRLSRSFLGGEGKTTLVLGLSNFVHVLPEGTSLIQGGGKLIEG